MSTVFLQCYGCEDCAVLSPLQTGPRVAARVRSLATSKLRCQPIGSTSVSQGILIAVDEDAQERQPLAVEGEYVPPAFNASHFHCPLCGVLAQMHWIALLAAQRRSDASRATCGNCNGELIWVKFKKWNTQESGGFWTDDWRMVRPASAPGPRPHPQMPEKVRADYEEARAIVAQSPRGACALLRFALQELLEHLGQNDKSPNDGIAALVKQGLPVETQQALDVLRVVGNNAVHPLELDLRDDVETATGLFAVLNFIVQDRIAQPKNIKKMFSMLPEGARKAIEKRDGASRPGDAP